MLVLPQPARPQAARGGSSRVGRLIQAQGTESQGVTESSAVSPAEAWGHGSVTQERAPDLDRAAAVLIEIAMRIVEQRERGATS